MRRVKQLMVNLLLMTAATLSMRGVGLLFNVWLTGRLGAEGVGLYALIMSVYGFAVTFSTSAVSLASSKMVAEAMGRGSVGEIRGAMVRCILYALSFGTAGMVLLYTLAPTLAAKAIGDLRALPSLKILALTLPPLALSSALNGYFTAVRRVYKNVTAQFAEQGVKIALTALLLSAFSASLTAACAAVAMGGLVSELLSLILSLVLYLFDLRRHNRSKRGERSPRGLTKKLLAITLPVSVGAYIRSGLVTVEHLLIPAGLKKFGGGSVIAGSAALAAYGTVHGMALPVVLFPQAFLLAFAGLLVPEVSESRAAGGREHIRYMVGRVFQISLLFSVGVAGVMTANAEALGRYIYGSAEAGLYIRLLSPLIPVMYLDSAVDAMLKGMDEQVYSMGVNIVDAALSVVLVGSLLPICGVWGYILMVYITEILNAAMSMTRLLRRTKVQLHLTRWLGLPLFCVLGATAFSTLFWRLMPQGGVISFIGRIVFSVILYLLLLCGTGAVTREDIRWMTGVVKG